MFNWYHERTKNKVVFVKKIGAFFKIVGAKYVDIKDTKVTIKVDKKKQEFNLTGGDLFNSHGKRLYIVDMHNQTNLVFKESKEKSILTPSELGGFLSSGFICGILEALDEQKYDIISIVIGVAIGVFAGLFLGRFF